MFSLLHQCPENAKKHAGEEKGSEDLLVVARDNQRQIDVEVGTSVICISRGHVSQWAAQPVHGQYYDFNEDDTSQNGKEPESFVPCGDWNRDDDADKNCPDSRVKQADGLQRAGRCRSHECQRGRSAPNRPSGIHR